MYRKFLSSEARPNSLTFPCLFKVCAKKRSIVPGFQILGHVVKFGMIDDAFICNSAIHMLCNCGFLESARQMFDLMPERDLISWNSMINGYLKGGRPGEALDLFAKMEMEPDEVTMIAVVLCCSALRDLNLGREFHRSIEERSKGLEFSLALSNSLLDMYVKCGSLEEAELLFLKTKGRTIVTWTTMISGYLKLGSVDVALDLFNDMLDRDIVTWNVMIGGFVQLGRPKDALTFFNRMQNSSVDPDEITMVNILSACAQLGAIDLGFWVDRFMRKHNFLMNVALGTALIDMYAKCGNIERARLVFSQMPEKNALTWTAMINGLAIHGLGHEAIHYFSMMISSGLTPDGVTFLGVLSACSHSGLVDPGRHYFDLMQQKFDLSPGLKHYSCKVDLLGRAGLLEEAENLVNEMPMKADAVIWASLFFASRFHRNVEMGERAAKKLLTLDKGDGATYVLLSGMYVEVNLWNEARKVRQLMNQRGLEKVPGCSSIEVNGKVHEFKVRDREHPLCLEIYACASLLFEHMKHVS